MKYLKFFIISSENIKDLFEIKNHKHYFQRDVGLQRRNVNTVLYGTETITSLGAQIWNLVPTFGMFKIS